MPHAAIWSILSTCMMILAHKKSTSRHSITFGQGATPMDCLRRKRLDHLSQVDRHLQMCRGTACDTAGWGLSASGCDGCGEGWAMQDHTEGLGSSSTHLPTWTAHMSDDGSTHRPRQHSHVCRGSRRQRCRRSRLWGKCAEEQQVRGERKMHKVWGRATSDTNTSFAFWVNLVHASHGVCGLCVRTHRQSSG